MTVTSMISKALGLPGAELAEPAKVVLAEWTEKFTIAIEAELGSTPSSNDYQIEVCWVNSVDSDNAGDIAAKMIGGVQTKLIRIPAKVGGTIFASTAPWAVTGTSVTVWLNHPTKENDVTLNVNLIEIGGYVPAP